MARPVSSLESHRQRQQIIDALVADTPYRQISAWTDPPVTIATLSRYKQHAVAVTREAVIAAKRAIANSDNGLDAVTTQAVTKAVMTVAADPFIARIQKHADTLDDAIEDARTDKDARGIAALIGTDLKGLELHARLAGRLDARPDAPATNLHVYLGIPRLDPGRSVPVQLRPADVEFIDAPADVGNKTDESDS